MFGSYYFGQSYFAQGYDLTIVVPIVAGDIVEAMLAFRFSAETSLAFHFMVTMTGER